MCVYDEFLMFWLLAAGCWLLAAMMGMEAECVLAYHIGMGENVSYIDGGQSSPLSPSQS